VVPKGVARAKELVALVADPNTLVPGAARRVLQVLVSALERLDAEIHHLETEIVRRAQEDATARRLMTIPGVGLLIATA
jgi:transposase